MLTVAKLAPGYTPISLRRCVWAALVEVGVWHKSWCLARAMCTSDVDLIRLADANGIYSGTGTEGVMVHVTCTLRLAEICTRLMRAIFTTVSVTPAFAFV